jgi:uncharacterized RDD family membrane protein YckC
VQPAGTRRPTPRLNLPSEGPGAIAPTGRRVGAFLFDVLASGLVAGLFTTAFDRHHATSSLPGSWSLIPFALNYVLGLTLLGRTLGMNLFGIRVVRADRPVRITVLDAVVRTILLALFVPALIWDKDARGLHDRVARTVVVMA